MTKLGLEYSLQRRFVCTFAVDDWMFGVGRAVARTTKHMMETEDCGLLKSTHIQKQQPLLIDKRDHSYHVLPCYSLREGDVYLCRVPPVRKGVEAVNVYKALAWKSTRPTEWPPLLRLPFRKR